MQQVSPLEDLMREHGVIQRLLLIYKNLVIRLNSGLDENMEVVYETLREATVIFKKFIEDYHQVLEEDYVFPVLRSYKEYNELITTLSKQHDAARCATSKLLDLPRINRDKTDTYNQQLSRLLISLITMYEPHTAREDTVVFPAFHQLTPPDKYNKLGETFEKTEEKKFGKNGFEKVVAQVSTIEKSLGINDLNKFTLECTSGVTTAQEVNSSLYNLLKDGGYILYSRHGEANVGQDSKNLDFNNCNTQRNLSEKGRAEAIEYGERLRSLQIPIEYPVIASPLCRTIETADLAFGDQNVLVDPFWYDVYRLSKNLSLNEQNNILKNFQSKLETLPLTGKNTVIIAHGLPDDISFGALDNMGTVILKPLGEDNGFEIIKKLKLDDIK